MEKSIENIWKEGFLKSDALLVPKINDLYNKKSIHIIDKFRRMFKINLIAIVVFSFVFSIVSYFVGIPLMGVIFFFALIVLVSINNMLLKSVYRYLNRVIILSMQHSQLHQIVLPPIVKMQDKHQVCKTN